MSEPNKANIIDYTQVPSTGSWGSYDEENDQWSWTDDNGIEHPGEAISGEYIRKWIQKKLAYGPYESIEEALAAIPVQFRDGFTVGIRKNGIVTDYQWKQGVDDDDLVEKVEQIDLTLHVNPGDLNNTVREGDPITLRFSISGRSNISRGYVYRVIGTSEVFVSEIPNLAKGEVSANINAPESSGTYVYRVRVIDSSGYYAKSVDGDSYLQYTIKYGGVSVSYNLSQFDKIVIKNIQSVQNQYFTVNISVRDDSYIIEGVYLSDGNTDILLAPHSNLNTVNDTFIGFNYYILPDADALGPLDGNTCFIKLVYREDGIVKQMQRDLFTLLKTDSLIFVSQSVDKNYYLNFPDYYTLQLQSGVAGISVYMQQDEGSDFTFDPVTVTTYNNYSLRVIPNAIKDNAILKVKCSFIIGGVEKTYRFENSIGNIINLPIGQYYVPGATSEITLDRIIEANDTDIRDAEVAQYYRPITNFTSEEYSTCAFIVDMYCKINKTGIKTTQYATIYQGTNVIGYITEDIINCRGLITDTPVGDWVQIGFGFNLEETVVRGNKEQQVPYFAIYINGMVVKTKTDISRLQYSADAPIKIEIGNGINIQKCFIYYRQGNQPAISPQADAYSIIYTNYLAHNPTHKEPQDLPVLKLMRMSDANTEEADRIKYFRLLKEKKEDVKHLTTFGTIGLPKADNMSAYDNTGDDVMDSPATLFRQSQNIKKPAQKEYCVLCRGSWYVNGTNILENCIIEVHTQGTSTLVYAVPNFKLTFWKVVNEEGTESLERVTPQFIQKENGGYYEESVYTAKADFMDSSHLNNTPTCNFYNKMVQTLMADDTEFKDFKGSPSARNGGIDAIVGFPIVIEISDSASSLTDQFVNIGSFMLNIDKTGDSLGFVTDEGTCLSLEGTSNLETTGGAGRFILPDTEMKDYRNADGTLNEALIEADAKEIQDAITASGKKLSLESELNGVKVKNHPYVKWCNFLSEGLEYRYPDSDIYKKSGGYLTKIMKASDFKKVYKMWIWVATSDSNANYKQEFTQHFDLYYCMLYFIQLMVFAQTDNLGKNAMFDTWDGEHWYPRPYDLDSQAGLDNNGDDTIAPFVEIMPEFSLDYDSNMTEEELVANKLTKESTIPYAGQDLDRYHFSSNTSKLWINFYKNYKAEIEAFYSRLRANGYTPEAIITQCQENLIDKLGISQYNQDFTNKYLGTVDHYLAYGNRWYKFKKWIKQRFAFCDSYFGNSDSASYNLAGNISYDVTVDSPQYIKQQYQESVVTKFVTSKINFVAGGGAATKITLWVNQDQISDLDLLKYVYFGNGDKNYTDLIRLDVSGNKKISTYTSLTGEAFTSLRELIIDDSTVTTINSLPKTITKISAKNTTLQNIELPVDCNVQEIDLTGAIINTDISFSRLPKLKTLNFTNTEFNGNVTLANLESLEFFIIKGAKFNKNVIIQDKVNIDDFDFTNVQLNGIIFDGDNIAIKKLNFTYTKFGQNTVNINAISNNIEELIFSGCTGLTHIEMTGDKKLTNIKTLALYGSSIKTIGGTTSYFDASKIKPKKDSFDISSLKNVIVSVGSDGTIISTEEPFTFSNTEIEYIQNLTWNGTGNSLFKDCINLKSIGGTITPKTSIDYMFYRCNVLETLPVLQIKNENSVTSAQYTFANASQIPYTQIQQTIISCTNVTNFYGCCLCTKLITKDSEGNSTTTEINLNTLFRNNRVVSNVGWMFAANYFNRSGLSSKTNIIKVTGNIPNTVTSTQAMFFDTTATIPYNIISSSEQLTDVSRMFANARVTFYAPNSTVVLPYYNKLNDNGDTEAVTLTDAIEKNFFFSGYAGHENKITTTFAMFQGSNCQTVDEDVFFNLTNLEDCSCTFMMLSGTKTFATNFAIDYVWRNNSKLTTVAGCFQNITNAYCAQGLYFNSGVKNITINGLLCLTGTNTNTPIINIDIDSTSSGKTLAVGDRVSYFGNTTNGHGVFRGRKVHITSSSETILSTLSKAADYMFYDATLYLENSVTTVDLTRVTDCNNMFRGCSAYRYKSIKEYTDEDRAYLMFIFPTFCYDYSYMFYSSNILQELPRIRSANAQNFAYTFANAVINVMSLVPADLFNSCRASLTSTYRMFYLNYWITGLQYQSERGLLADCINLSDVRYMFSDTPRLVGGIPNNIFGSTQLTKITNLDYMFNRSAVFYGVADASYKWVDAVTIQPLVNLTSIQYTFNRTRHGNIYPQDPIYRNIVKAADGTTDKYVIDPLTFYNTNLENISFAFAGSPFDIPFKFSRFQYAKQAFFCSNITEIGDPFVSNDYISRVSNVQSMFEKNINNNTSVTNLGKFINALVSSGANATMNSIAGSLTNTDVSTELLNPSGIDTAVYVGRHFLE